MYMSRLASLTPLLSLTSANIVTTITYNGIFDDINTSVKEFACWNGKPGSLIEDQGWVSLADLPFVLAGYEGVDGPDSPLCGTCWLVEYDGSYIPMIVIDSAKSGFATDIRTMDSITGGQATELGRVNVTAMQSPYLSDCGLGFGGAEEDQNLGNLRGGNWYSTWFYELFEEPPHKEYMMRGNMNSK
ncbi:uncharacterized protein FIESC28_02777 [Fusarium coffeatum]|uniref:Uncharacterized protein n=1 Tax=Fusarium coffeatum TaxID=231269 RepID=A0A366S4M2_9HYPO|nr:uncharacterized protein FIESC28_02777 [Fusarium coffeatum]RBR24287.1 hypothetical protein FIESC28_02777 [Fusarium coffeatum]